MEVRAGENKEVTRNLERNPSCKDGCEQHECGIGQQRTKVEEAPPNAKSTPAGKTREPPPPPPPPQPKVEKETIPLLQEEVKQPKKKAEISRVNKILSILDSPFRETNCTKIVRSTEATANETERSEKSKGEPHVTTGLPEETEKTDTRGALVTSVPTFVTVDIW